MLVVAGGGGGGAGGGGGGAGGLISNTAYPILVDSSLTVTVGAGGSGAAADVAGSTGARGGSGANSVFDTLTAIGGGGGAGAIQTAGNGGSGGGAGWSGHTGGTGTAGQGNRGGNDTARECAGGGGSGGAGVDNSGADIEGPGTNGGAATSSSISGSAVSYAGGGGGGASAYFSGSDTETGGTGGGNAGNGGSGNNGSPATAGVANCGGGGGGGGAGLAGNGYYAGAAGGSGVVIIRYKTGLFKTATGGTITTVGSDTVHTFTSSGTFAVTLQPNGLFFIGSVGGGSTNGNSVTTPGMDTTGATFLVAMVSNYSGGIPTFSDAYGNTWIPLTLQGSGGGHAYGQLYYCAAPSVGAGHTFSASGTSTFPTVTALAFSANKTLHLEQQAGAFTTDNGGSTTVAPGSISPARSGELIISGATGSVSATSISSVSGGMTLPTSVASDGTTHVAGGIAYLFQTPGASINPTWTFGSASNQLVAAVASFAVPLTAGMFSCF